MGNEEFKELVKEALQEHAKENGFWIDPETHYLHHKHVEHCVERREDIDKNFDFIVERREDKRDSQRVWVHSLIRQAVTVIVAAATTILAMVYGKDGL